jgi:hypothetical protein
MSRFLFAAAALLPLAAAAGVPATLPEAPNVTITEVRDAEWAGYRHGYKAAARYAHLTRTRPLIQAHMQILPLDPAGSLDGLKILLVGEKTLLEIPVDAIGRANLPLLKQAYDEDAVLRLNRQKGHYRFSGRFSIRERDDGIYSAPELRAACEQMISAQREDGNLFRLLGKQCVGVKFIYPLADSDAAITFRDDTGKTGTIAAAADQPYSSRPIGLYKVATYRFADWPQLGQVIAAKRPLAIATVYQ